MTTRHRAREIVLQMLFQHEASLEPPDKVVQTFTDSFGEGSLPDQFCTELFTEVAAHIEELDQTITSASDHWRLERMSGVDRNILRLGVYEISRRPGTPARVVINEAVELAKKFGADESAGFVNGVLDRIAKELGQLD